MTNIHIKGSLLVPTFMTKVSVNINPCMMFLISFKALKARGSANKANRAFVASVP